MNNGDYDEETALKAAIDASLKTEDQFKPKETLKPLGGMVELYKKRLTRGLDTSSILVATDTDFWYYNCNDEIDRGWGCTYRVIQTIFSNLKKRGCIGENEPVPTLRNIQQALSELPGYDRSIIGSKKWLEPPDSNRFFRAYGVIGYDTKYNLGDERVKQKLADDLRNHFSTIRTPVMVDDKYKTFGVLGVADSKSGENYVLIFDPHVHVTESLTLADIKSNKIDRVGWKTFKEHFKSKTWMVLFPLRVPPSVDESAANGTLESGGICTKGCLPCVIS
mmetsp:Transcript_477/g.854  ORF Transcript_477/g.854 Transcript_477/m.854 type:complete len:278 (+) Transcript_477:59-892(+)